MSKEYKEAYKVVVCCADLHTVENPPAKEWREYTKGARSWTGEGTEIVEEVRYYPEDKTAKVFFERKAIVFLDVNSVMFLR